MDPKCIRQRKKIKDRKEMDVPKWFDLERVKNIIESAKLEANLERGKGREKEREKPFPDIRYMDRDMYFSDRDKYFSEWEVDLCVFLYKTFSGEGVEYKLKNCAFLCDIEVCGRTRCQIPVVISRILREIHDQVTSRYLVYLNSYREEKSKEEIISILLAQKRDLRKAVIEEKLLTGDFNKILEGLDFFTIELPSYTEDRYEDYNDFLDFSYLERVDIIDQFYYFRDELRYELKESMENNSEDYLILQECLVYILHNKRTQFVPFNKYPGKIILNRREKIRLIDMFIKSL